MHEDERRQFQGDGKVHTAAAHSPAKGLYGCVGFCQRSPVRTPSSDPCVIDRNYSATSKSHTAYVRCLLKC